MASRKTKPTKEKFQKARGTATTVFAPAPIRWNLADPFAEKFRSRLWLVLLLLVTFAVFSNALRNDFVSDDTVEVLRNERIRSWANLPLLFTRPSGGLEQTLESRSGTYYRPIQGLIYMLGWSLFGTHAWGYHLILILLHVIVTGLVYTLILRLTENPLVALAGGALFGLHAIHTESVEWISGITDVSCAVFYVLAFHSYLRAREERGGIFSRAFLVSTGWFFLALLSKEMAVTLPLVVLALEVLKRTAFEFNAWRTIANRVAVYFGAVAIYFLLRSAVILQRLSPEALPLTPVTLVFSAIKLLGLYLQKMVWPPPLNYFYGFSHLALRLDRAVVLLAAVLLVLVGFFWFGRRAWKAASFGFFWFVVALLPPLKVDAIQGTAVFAERYLYIPSIGFAMLVPTLLWIVLKKISWPQARWIYAAVAVLYVTALAGMSYLAWQRAYDWRTTRAILEKTAQTSQNPAPLHYLLGMLHSMENRHGEAVKHYFAAIEFTPQNYLHLGGEEYLSALTREQVYKSALVVGSLFFQQDKYNEAKIFLEQAAANAPNRARLERDLTEITSDSNPNYSALQFMSGQKPPGTSP